MKPVIIPILLLVAVVVFVVLNGENTEKELTYLIKITKELPDKPNDDTIEELEKLEKAWKKQKEHFSAVIKFDFVYNFSKEMSSAKAGAHADDAGTYLSAKKGMLNILEYIRDVQRLRFDNII